MVSPNPAGRFQAFFEEAVKGLCEVANLPLAFFELAFALLRRREAQISNAPPDVSGVLAMLGEVFAPKGEYLIEGLERSTPTVWRSRDTT